MKKKILLVLFVGIVAIQIGVIGVLGISVYSQFLTAQSYSINEIDQNSIYIPDNSRYEYFYDARSNIFLEEEEVFPAGLNAEGFRDRYDYELQAKSNVVRIVTLGDSNTYGLHVPVENIFPEFLEDLLNEAPLCAGKKYEVINLGMHGYDLLFAEERFRLRGTQYNPDVVLWYIQGNDLDEYENEEQKILVQLRNEGFDDGQEAAIIAREEVYKTYKKSTIVNLQLSTLQNVREYYDGKLLLFGASDYFNLYSHTEIKHAVGRAKNIEVFWPFSKILDEHIIDNFGHPNPDGHAFIAESVYAHLASHPELLPCDL